MGDHRTMASWGLLFCCLVAFCDGWDTQSIGPAAMPIAAELGMPLSAMGPVFSAAQVGFIVGAAWLGPVGDRVGRRRVLLLAIALFALGSLCTGLASSYPFLLAARLLTGFGLGGATPNFISMAAESVSPTLRPRAVMVAWASVPLGGMAGAFAAAAIISAWGWRASFLVGFAAPILLLPLGLSLREPERKSVEQAPRVAIAALLAPTWRMRTLLMWAAALTAQWTLIGVANWTPILLGRAGLSPASAASGLALYNAGGVLGTLAMALTLTARPPAGVLRWAGAAGVAAVASIGVFAASGFPGGAVPAWGAAALAGALTTSAVGALLGVATMTYPTPMRAGGVGWVVAFGRIGAILAPLAIGLLAASGARVDAIYAALALPLLVAAIAGHVLAQRGGVCFKEA